MHAPDKLKKHDNFLDAISDDEWVELWRKLRVFAHRKYGILFHADVDDIVVQAVIDTMSGRRQWPAERMDLFSFLCGVVRSLMSHNLEKERRKVSLDSLDLRTNRRTLDLERFSTDLRHPTNLERHDENDLFSRQLLREFSKDAVVASILRLVLSDSNLRPREIAEALGLSMSEMRAAQKRLRRRWRRAFSLKT